MIITNSHFFSNSSEKSFTSNLSIALSSNNVISILDVSGNKLGPAGAASLKKGIMASSSLHEINLGGNSIGDAGVAEISDALATNTSITFLYLELNYIRNEGAASLARVLEFQRLTLLDLAFNHIAVDGAR